MLNIDCKNIKDFCELIDISIGQGIKTQCIFASSKSSYPSVSFVDTPKDHKSFTYVFFTPLYTAIYSGNVKSNIADDEYNLLKETCSKHELYIHCFDKLKYNSQEHTLLVDTHIEVI